MKHQTFQLRHQHVFQFLSNQFRDENKISFILLTHCLIHPCWSKSKLYRRSHGNCPSSAFINFRMKFLIFSFILLFYIFVPTRKFNHANCIKETPFKFAQRHFGVENFDKSLHYFTFKTREALRIVRTTY